MRKQLSILCIFIAVLIFVNLGYAEDWTSIGEPDCSPTSECVYIGDHGTHAGYNSGGAGDGSDWNNTLDTWPSSYTRGKKYYVADGS